MSELRDIVDRFIEDAATLNAAEAEQPLLPIVRELAKMDGFELVDAIRHDSQATIFIAHHRLPQNETLAVEYTHYDPSRPVAVRAIDQFLLAAER